MNDDKLKILFIAGNGRSGSTILHNILGQLDGFCALGELRYIWERGVLKNWLCGCGVPFHECPMWQQTMAAAFGGLEAIDAREMFRFTESFRIQDLPFMLLPGRQKKEMERLRPYLDRLASLYHAIQSTTGSRVIVDSSKNPSYGYLLRFIPGTELYVLHFIRDSLGAAYSWSKKKEFQPGVYMARKKPIKSALQWNARNLATELFLPAQPERFMRLRYEDFIENPQTSIAAILNMLGETEVALPFTASHTVELNQANHSVFGNAVRFQQGPVALHLDNRWRTKMARKHKLAVTALTWPLRLRYGYLRLTGLRRKTENKQNKLAGETFGH
jgi:hypothetical protein